VTFYGKIIFISSYPGSGRHLTP